MKIFYILFLFLSGAQLIAQPVYKNLVFEGAGIRGLAYAGALMELENQNMMQDVEKVGGTSAGAIVATAIALGYSGKELEQLISSMRFKQFNDNRFFFIGGLISVYKHFGWYRGKKFDKWMGQLIEAKTGNADITFKELDEAGYLSLYITGTCLNKQRLLVFSAETYPDMKVRDAVRASMSIPFYYRAVFIDENGKRYQKPKHHNNLDVIVDGGITGNFPIQIFDRTYIVNGEEKRIENPNTLGFRIDSDPQIEYDKSGNGLVPIEIKNMRDYIMAFYIYTLENANRNQLNANDWKRTVSISSAGIGPKVKKLSKKQKALLIASGRSGVADFVNRPR